jgi:hypothetical protein
VLIRLAVERAYDIEPALYAPLIGAEPERIESFSCLRMMAFPSGRLLVDAVARQHPGDDGSVKDAARILIDLHGGELHFRDLTAYLVESSTSRFVQNWWNTFAFDDYILYLQETNRALLVPTSDQAPIELTIRRPIGDAVINEKVAVPMAPNPYSHLVSNDGVVPVPLAEGGGSFARHLAFLTINVAEKEARWSAWLPASVSSSRDSWLDKFFRKESNPQTMAVAASELPRFRIRDFPIAAHDFQPLVNQALCRDGQVFIYTKGQRDSPKYGHECSIVARIRPDGQAISTPFRQDYTGFQDSKSRGLEGHFTTSGRYCILYSIYGSTDPWGGQPRLFDMDSHELVEVKLPRGFSKYRVVDHIGDFAWLELWPAPNVTPRLVCCSMQT